jgi:chitodextrinase
MRVKRFSPFVVAAIIVVYLVTGLVSLASATVIFSDGFESGDFGAWTDVYGSPNVVSDVKYAGYYCGFVNTSGTHTCYYGEESSAGWGNHLFARGYYRFDVSTVDWATRGCTYISNWTGSDDLIVHAILGHWTDDDYLWMVEVLNGTDFQTAESSTFSLNTSAWYCIELEAFIDGSTGYAKLYVDNVLVVSLVGVDDRKYGNPNHVGFGQLYDTRNGEAVWWDCCVIDDSYIGLELPPTPVTLSQATDITENSLKLSWTENADSDFKNYTIYQSSTPGNLGNAVHTITDKLTTSFVLTGLSANTTYYFTIRVYDTCGLYADSNQFSAKTNAPITPNLPPTPVTLSQATDITENALGLSWTENIDVDFKNYTIYQSSALGSLGNAVHTVTDKFTTSFVLTGLSANTTYYFTIRVYDTGGLYADSNQIGAKTSAALPPPNFPPTPVTLSQATDITENSLKLSWTENADSDLRNYTIYQSTITGAIGTAITAVTGSSLTSYDVTGLSENTTYYFMIRVYDAEGLYADSNQISATTHSTPSETSQFPLVLAIVGLAVAAVAIILIVYYIMKKDRKSVHPTETN